MKVVYQGVIHHQQWQRPTRSIELQAWADLEEARRELWTALHEVASGDGVSRYHVSGEIYVGYRVTIETRKGPKFELADVEPVWQLFYRAGKYYWESQTHQANAV